MAKGGYRIGSGRPPHDKKSVMQQMLHWAKLPSSLHIGAFCEVCDPWISPRTIMSWDSSDEEFSEFYEYIKMIIWVRREEAHTAGELSNKAFEFNSRYFDSFSMKQWEKELIFKHKLDSSLPEKVSPEIESKFQDIIDIIKASAPQI